MSEIKTVSGVVERVGDVEEVGSNGFTKRLLVIEVEDGQYSQKIPVEALKDKTSLFDGLNIGDNVTAYVNMRGSEWNDRVFLSLNCWKVESESAGIPQNSIPSDKLGEQVEDDDLAF